MKEHFKKLLISLNLTVMTALLFLGCSSAVKDPLSGTELAVQPDIFGVNSTGRSSLISFDVLIDPALEIFKIEPSDRSADYHFPLTDLYPNVLAITWVDFGPPFQADIRLQHPYPGQNIAGFDPRVIAVLPANPGVSMDYPYFDVVANNSTVMNPDGYTKLFDKAFDGNANPFIAYFKDEPNRIWSGLGQTSETKRWTLDLSGFGGPITFKLVVDVSTNFPSPPQPVTDNCPEPAEIISVDIGSGLHSSGGSAIVEVKILDWQSNFATNIALESPDLFYGARLLEYTYPAPEPNEYIFRGVISNTNHAPPGLYRFLVVAKDNVTGLALYNEYETEVGSEQNPSTWQIDQERNNVAMGSFNNSPGAGSDLAVVDSGAPELDGVLFYDELEQIVKVNLDLSDSIFYGDSLLPFNQDPFNLHPTPNDPMPSTRIDASNEGRVVRVWDDSHLGVGPDTYGHYQRCDSGAGIYEPFGGVLQQIAMVWQVHATEKPTAYEVWDEADSGICGVMWRGNIDTTLCWLKGIDNWDQSFSLGMVNSIRGVDASQDPYREKFYWGLNDPSSGKPVVLWMNKVLGQSDFYNVLYDQANVLDMELIPLQDPPIVVGGTVQQSDWVAVLLDNDKIEIMNPLVSNGEYIGSINLSALIGDPVYIDVADQTGDVFVSHTDGVTPYCSVFVLE